MPSILRFQMSGRLVFGAGVLAELPQAVRVLQAARPLLVTDAGIVKAGLCQQVCDTLAVAGIHPAVFDRVESDPCVEVAEDCLRSARDLDCDLLIGLGGGSSLDIAKVTAVVLTNGGAALDYAGIDKVPQPGLPTIMLPTTAGTGSEVTPIAVLTDKAEHLKKGIVSDRLYPSVALVDPQLMLGLPPRITAFTGMDALTHAIEAFTNKFAQPFIDTFALEAIRLIGKSLARAVRCGSDLPARHDMALGSLYGGLCLGSVNTAAVHALAYPLGGTFDVPHGVANALLLPHVMKFNLPANTAKFVQIAAALGKDVSETAEEEAAKAAVAAVTALAAEIGIVSRIRDLGIPEVAIDDMAAAAMKVTRLLNNNPRGVTLDDARRIYREAY